VEPIIGVISEDDTELEQVVDHVIRIPARTTRSRRS
jgi:hypothetical protein